MTLPTNFSADSPIGRMWSELLAQARREGRDPAVLEQEADRGFDAFLPIFERQNHLNTRGTIEAGEVVEYAYSQPVFFRLLQKYGFPAPYEMDDQDSRTTPARRAVGDIVRKRKDELAKIPGMVPSSDAYRREFAKRIYEDLIPIISAWNKDCPVEEPAWKAYNDKCGACGEMGTLLYYAYSVAGLKPIFLGMNRGSSVASEMTVLVGGSEYGSAHLYVGVPLDHGKVVEADLALRRFDAPQPYGVQLTPRQAAEMFLLSQKGKVSSDADYESIIGTLARIAPETSVYSFLSLDRRYYRMNPPELESSISAILARFGSTDKNQYQAELMRARLASFQSRGYSPDKLFELMDRIAVNEPSLGCFLATDNAMMLLDGLDNQMQGITAPDQLRAFNMQHARAIQTIRNLLVKAIDWDTNYFYAFYQLGRLVNVYLTPEESVALMRELAGRHPDHPFIQMNLARALLQQMNHAGSAKEEEELLHEGSSVMHRLMASPASGDFMVSALAARYAMYNLKPQEALQHARRSFDSLQDLHPFAASACSDVFTAAMIAGDWQLSSRAIDRWKRISGASWSSQAADILSQPWHLYYRAGGRTRLQSGAVAARASRIAVLLDELVRNGLPKEKAEEIAARHAVIALSLSGGHPDASRDLLKCIRDPRAAHVLQASKFVAGAFVVPMMRHSQFNRSSIESGLRSVEAVERLLAPQDSSVLLDAYRVFADKGIELGREDVARESLHHVTLATGSDGTARFYEEVCRIRVTDAAPYAEKQKEALRSLAALRVLWEERASLDASHTQAAALCCDYAASLLNSSSDSAAARGARELAESFRKFNESTAVSSRAAM